jgi:asparagine synthase (glutamine-hydrolysing)
VWHTESPILERLASQASAALARMRDAGAGRLLTGHWGDQVLSDSDYLLDLLRAGRWRLLKQHLSGWGISAPGLAVRFARAVAARHLPTSLKLAARQTGSDREAAAWQSPWFTGRFRQILRERAAFAPMMRPAGGSHASAIYRQSRMGYHVQCMEWNTRSAGMHDLEVAFPYLDCDLIQFLMAIPGEVQSHEGVPRGLMRAAMRRLVPLSIVERRTKGEFTHLTNDTLESDFAAIVETLGSSALAVQFGYVEGAVLRKALGEWRTAARTVRNAVLANRVIDLCGFELLLRRFFAVEGAGRVASLHP